MSQGIEIIIARAGRRRQSAATLAAGLMVATAILAAAIFNAGHAGQGSTATDACSLTSNQSESGTRRIFHLIFS
jgi:hypothetical protein